MDSRTWGSHVPRKCLIFIGWLRDSENTRTNSFNCTVIISSLLIYVFFSVAERLHEMKIISLKKNDVNLKNQLVLIVYSKLDLLWPHKPFTFQLLLTTARKCIIFLMKQQCLLVMTSWNKINIKAFLFKSKSLFKLSVSPLLFRLLAISEIFSEENFMCKFFDDPISSVKWSSCILTLNVLNALKTNRFPF